MIRPRARRDGLLSKDVGDELVVYDQSNQEVHRLNRAAAVVWKHCDGVTSREELAAIVESDMQVNCGRDFVDEALARLEDAKLLEGRAGLSRGQKVMLVGAAALMLPIVDTLTAPTAAASVSGFRP